MSDFRAKIKTETFFNHKLVFLSVSHDGGVRWNSVRIENPLQEIPYLIKILTEFMEDLPQTKSKNQESEGE